MTRKLERSPLYGVDCHESMGALLNDHLSDAADRSRERPKRPILLIFLSRLQKGIAFSLFFWYNRPEKRDRRTFVYELWQ